MAEFGFILSKTEEANLLRVAIDAGAWLVPDIDMESPELRRIRSAKEYDAFRRETRKFFIVHPSFLKAPLEVREILKDGRRVFFIMQKNGGPAIEFLSSIEFDEGDQAKINPGFLAHYETYWNPATIRNEETPEALLGLYRSLAEAAKKMSIRKRVGVRSYWIGKEVLELLGSGRLQLGVNSGSGKPATVE